MPPYQNRSRAQHDSYNSCEDSYSSCLESDQHHQNQHQVMAEEESGTSSNLCLGEEDHDDERWLQLGLGGSSSGPDMSSTPTPNHELDHQHPHHHHQQKQQHPQHVIIKPLAFNPSNTSLLTLPQQQLSSWGYKPYNNHWPPPSSLPPPPPMGMYFQYPPYNFIHSGFSGLRVIDPPRRRFPDVWFMIQASKMQAREPFLPQVSKRYIRIKDGKLTVRLLIKYLVHKLGLNSESEVEITCRGHQLSDFLTLQHVRDNIWHSRDTVSLLIDPSTTAAEQIMVLNYSRTS